MSRLTKTSGRGITWRCVDRSSKWMTNGGEAALLKQSGEWVVVEYDGRRDKVYESETSRLEEAITYADQVLIEAQMVTPTMEEMHEAWMSSCESVDEPEYLAEARWQSFLQVLKNPVRISAH